MAPSSKPVSADDLYRRSSQYQHWSFTPAALGAAKAAANAAGRDAAVARFHKARMELKTAKPELFEQHGDALMALEPETISLDEEKQYLHFFCLQIVQICTHFNMPTQVKATAVSFFKKFYLVHLAMQHRPRNVLYTIVFLAAKLENHFVSIESFCSRIPNTKPEDILLLEFVVLSSLKFTLLVHHPFRPLHGFFLDFQQVLLIHDPVYGVSVDNIGNLYDRAKKWLNDHALLSDVCFLYTPPQIALAALYALDQQLTEKYLRRKFPPVKKKLDRIDETLEPLGKETLEPLGKEMELVEKEPLQTLEKKPLEPLEPLELLEPLHSKPEKPVDHYQLLLSTITQCIQVATLETETSREQSTLIDKKCFFALNPAKLLKKKVKALTGE